MYHPRIALSTLYLIELMHNVDYSVAGALLVLAGKFMSRMVGLSHAIGRRRSSSAARGLNVHRCTTVRDPPCRCRGIRRSSPRLTEDT
jgi:hypothetical protein